MTGNTYNQPKPPSTGTTHSPFTRHYRKGSPGVKTRIPSGVSWHRRRAACNGPTFRQGGAPEYPKFGDH